MPNRILSYGCNTIRLSIQLVHFSCLQVWVVINTAIMSFNVQMFVWTYIFISLVQTSRMEWLGNRINVCLTFFKNYQLFSIVVVTFYVSIHSIHQLQLPHIFYKIWYGQSFFFIKNVFNFLFRKSLLLQVLQQYISFPIASPPNLVPTSPQASTTLWTVSMGSTYMYISY